MVRTLLVMGIGIGMLAAQEKPAAPGVPGNQVTLADAVREAIDKNLGLLAERYNVTIAEARILTARLRPNPVLTLDSDYIDFLHRFNRENQAGPTELSARTDFVLERGGKRERRIEVADNARAVAQLQLLNTTRTLVLDVESAFVEVLAAKETLALARENLKSFNAIVEVNTNRVKAGDLAQVELLRSQVAALQFQNAVRQADSRMKLARTRLQALMGRPYSLDFDAVGELRRDAAPLDMEEFRRAAIELRPDLQALKRDQARSTADLRLQMAQGKVDFTVSSQYHWQFDNAKGNSIGFFFSAPLPVFNRNQGEIERARREQQQIEARIRALEHDIRAEVESAYQQYGVARELLENVERNMLAQARDVRETIEYSYRRGEATFVDLLDAQRAFNDTMQSYNEARADFARSLYLIDSISGKGVTP
jgi:cobalt-zinc-cadmium efflux system outer membrane protein